MVYKKYKEKFDAVIGFYILHHFKSIYNIFDINTSYGIANSSRIQIKKCTTNFFKSNNSIPERIIWKTWKNTKIPFFFSNNDNQEIITYKNDQAIINYDIIASAFYLLSGWQEYFTSNNVKSERFSYNSSIQCKLGIVTKPIVNYYFDILKTAIEKVYDKELRVSLWGDNSFATFISHDIDKCNSAWIEGSYSEIKKGNLFTPFKLILKRIFINDEWFNFEQIISLEKKHNATSTFFFLAKKGKHDFFLNADYDIKDKKIRKVFKLIEDNNSEIAIHGSIGTHTNSQQLASEITKFNKKICGNRFHLLNYDVDKTPNILETNNIKYDSTLGFAEHIGFRNSYCFPFVPYNLKDDKPYSFLEIPLIIMDTTLYHKKYMKISQQDILPEIILLIDEVKKFNGCFSLLWHNNYFSKYKYKGWCDIYEEIVKRCVNLKSGFYTGENIYNLWRKYL